MSIVFVAVIPNWCDVLQFVFFVYMDCTIYVPILLACFSLFVEQTDYQVSCENQLSVSQND